MRRVTALQLAQALAAAATVDEVRDAIQRLLPSVLDAASATLGIVDADAQELRLWPADTAHELAVRYARLPLDAPMPIAEVVRTGQLLVLRNHDDWRAHAPPDVVADILLAGLVTTAFVPLMDDAGIVEAALAVAWDDVIEVEELVLGTLGTTAELCRHALGRARATDEAARRARGLAALAEHLADALTVDQALEVVSREGQVPVEAAATSIGLVDVEAGLLRTFHGQSVDDGVRRRYADPPLAAGLAFTDAARTNEPIYIGDYDAYRARYPDSAHNTARLGRGARAAVPVRTAAGDPIGSIVHAWAGPRTFDDALVSVLTTIADMAGQAIERARLLEQRERTAARSEALAGLAELLTKARTSHEVAEAMARHSAAVAGADSANVALLDPGGATLRIHHPPAVAVAIQDRYRSVPLDAPIPHADVVRDGGVLVLEDLDAFGARYPHLLDDLKAAGRQGCAVVPLPDSQGRPLGAVGFSWTDPVQLDDDGLSVLSDVASLCAQALERAHLTDAEHRLVTSLQDSVLVSLPTRAGLDGAARYRPSAHDIRMGGDWYQGIELGESRYALIVGDVAGHGITAVGDMAQLRAALEALVRVGTPLDEVFGQATDMLRARERTVTATALVAVLDLAASTVTYAAAGHPPPLLRTSDGDVVVLDEGRQALLGFPLSADARRDVGTHAFPAGATLVAYTDGLIERRDESFDVSQDRLVGRLRSAPPGDSAGLADHLLAASLSDHQPDDDVAIVVMTRSAD